MEAWRQLGLIVKHTFLHFEFPDLETNELTEAIRQTKSLPASMQETQPTCSRTLTNEVWAAVLDKINPNTTGQIPDLKPWWFWHISVKVPTNGRPKLTSPAVPLALLRFGQVTVKIQISPAEGSRLWPAKCGIRLQLKCMDAVEDQVSQLIVDYRFEVRSQEGRKASVQRSKEWMTNDFVKYSLSAKA